MMNTGESIGKAWNAAAERLPDGWVINRLELQPTGQVVLPDGSITQAENVWCARARPFTGFAWRSYGKVRLADAGVRAYGRSPVEALLALAVRVEQGVEGKAKDYRPDLSAIDKMFTALFPDA